MDFSRKIKGDVLWAECKIFKFHPKISSLNAWEVLNSHSSTGKTSTHCTALIFQGTVASNIGQKISLKLFKVSWLDAIVFENGKKG